MLTKFVRELIDAIKEVVYPPYEEGRRVKKQQLTLTEDHPDATCREVVFTLPKGRKILIYKFDKQVYDKYNNVIEDPLPIFEEGKARTKPDYIVFYEYYQGNDERLCIVICNMKSKKTGNMKGQMRAGRDLSEYILKTAIRCLAMGKDAHYHTLDYEDLKRADYFIFKEIAISDIPPSIAIPKGTTKRKKKIKKYSPQTPVKCGQTHNFEDKIEA